jgi:hypothetical protein
MSVGVLSEREFAFDFGERRGRAGGFLGFGIRGRKVRLSLGRTYIVRGLSLMVALVVVGGSTLSFAGGGALYEQTPSADPELNVVSQAFSDAPTFNTVAADDFAVPAGPGWNVTDLGAVFTTGNGSGLDPAGMSWTIYADDNGAPGVALVQLEGGSLDVNTGLAGIDLDASGDAMELSSGDYWMSSQIIGAIGLFGQEFQMGSDDGAGTANFRWDNPGGAFGFPGSWIDGNGTVNPDTDEPFSDVRNLAFSIGGAVVPEPATLGLLGVGLVAAVRRRRR